MGSEERGIISLSARDEKLDTHQLRHLARYCMSSHSRIDMMGISVIQRELNKGCPAFPIVDELIKTVAARILWTLGLKQLTRTQTFHVKFDSEEAPDLTHRVMRHVVYAAQGRPGSNFYLDLLGRATDEDVVCVVRVLFDLYACIDRGTANVEVA